MNSRQSNFPCPNCGKMLYHPDQPNDHHDWDCFNCGLEVPGSAHCDGRDILRVMWENPDAIDVLIKLFPNLKAGVS